jgi:hypothetical protein
MLFNATFNNMSAISRWLVLLKKPPTCRKSLTNLITYRLHLAMSGIRTSYISWHIVESGVKQHNPNNKPPFFGTFVVVCVIITTRNLMTETYELVFFKIDYTSPWVGFELVIYPTTIRSRPRRHPSRNGCGTSVEMDMLLQ